MRTVRSTTHSTPSPASEDLLDLCAAEVAETVPLVMRVLRRTMREAAAGILSVPQVRTLIYLKHHEGASLAALAEHLGVSSPTASALVERLVRRELVCRALDPRERRRVVLGLTPAGARLVERVVRTTRAHVRERLASLTPPRLAELCQGMRILQEVFRVGDS